jgi:hypothetical protein
MSRHGYAGKYNRTPEYYAWLNMIQRCYNPRAGNFDDYGGRGITVCSEWRESFVQFLTDVGHRPSPTHSLNRLDNDKGYSKENCEWSTRRKQNQNKRSTNSFVGVKRHRRKWEAGIKINGKRIYLGLYDTPEEASEAYWRKARELDV